MNDNTNEFGKLFRNPSFVRLFSGRVVTDAGDSLYFVGAMWLVWELTGSQFYTGLAGALVQLPTMLNFLTGPLIDRWNFRRLLLSTQVINGVGVLLVPVAAMLDLLSVWLVLGLMPLLTFVNSVVYPAQSAALPRIVDDERLTKANSLFSTSRQTVDMVANAVAGGLIAIIGAIALFYINSITFFVAAVLFIGVTVPAPSDTAEFEDTSDGIDNNEPATTELRKIGNEYLADLREGVSYVRGSAVTSMLFGAMVVNFVYVGATAVLPAFADSLGGSGVYGLLLAALAGGGLVGTVGSFLVEETPFGVVAIVGFPVAGVSWLGAIALPEVWTTVMLLFVAGVPIGVFNVLFQTMLQSTVEDELLGRVMSVVTSISSVMMPAGALLGGTIADITGSSTILYAGGATFVALGGYFCFHQRLRLLPSVIEADEKSLGLGSGDASPAPASEGH